MLDIFFIQYDEPRATEHFAALSERFMFAKRIRSVQGIHQAHIKAARLSTTENFYVVDADAVVYESFDFEYTPEEWDKHYTHVWYADNPVNGNCYGYGGIKLFNKSVIASHDPTSVDFTTASGNGMKVIETPTCVTKFDQSPLLTFRSVVREVVKLSRVMQQNEIAAQRYEKWLTTTPNTEFVDAYLKGLAVAAQLISDPTFSPALINDYTKLTELFQQ